MCAQCAFDVGVVYCVSEHGASIQPWKRVNEEKSQGGKRR